jgi:hypothetical protein
MQYWTDRCFSFDYPLHLAYLVLLLIEIPVSIYS